MRATMSNLAPVIGVAAACRMLGVPRSASYRAHRTPAPMPADGTPSLADGSADGQVAADGHAPMRVAPVPPDPAPADLPPAARCSPRALSAEERTQVWATLKSERFADCTPREV